MTPTAILCMFLSAVSLWLGMRLALSLYGHGLAFAEWAGKAIRYPFELDYGEGPILYQTMKLMKGHSFYTPPAIAPYNIGNYPPLYHIVTAFVSLFHQPVLSSGRWVSVICTIAIALAVAVITFLSSGAGRKGDRTDYPQYAIRALGGLTAAFIFLSAKPTLFWGAFMRVDMLAIALSIGGVLSFMLIRDKGWRPLITVALFVAAAFTKQSTVAGAVAVLLTMAIFRPRRAALFTGVGLVLGAVLFLIIDIITRGQFYFHLVTANDNAFHWETVQRVFTEVLTLQRIPWRLAIIGALTSLALAWPQQGRKREWRILLPLYLAASFAVSLTVGKVGSSYNYLVEFMAAMSICGGILISDSLTGLCRVAESRTRTLLPRILTGILAVAGTCVVVQQVGSYAKTYDPRTSIWLPATDEGAREAGEQVLSRVMLTTGPVFSEVMTFLPQGDKDVDFQPFELTQLSYQGIWDQNPLLRDIEDRKYSLVMLQFDMNGDTSWHNERFTPEMINAIRNNYAPSGYAGGIWFYEPNR